MVSNETVLHFDRKYAPQNIAMNVLTTNEFHLLGFFLLVLSTVVKDNGTAGIFKSWTHTP